MDALLASIKRSAEIFDVDRRVVRGWITAGKLTAVTVPGTQIIRIPITELERFVRENCIPVKGPIRPPRKKKGQAA